ncbi:MAG: hypothetical protein M5U28_21840 [Sandaracinaceae bacterium]|nr:hypothetical protein [Sandaracinaceae bacterium]
MYAAGRGVTEDLSAARSIFERACTPEVLAGCRALGELYEEGRGAERDYGRARELYERACAGGETGAASASATSTASRAACRAMTTRARALRSSLPRRLGPRLASTSPRGSRAAWAWPPIAIAPARSSSRPASSASRAPAACSAAELGKGRNPRAYVRP